MQKASLRVTEIDDGEPIAVPENWEPDDGAAPPRLTVIEKSRGRGSKGMPALKVGDRILSRTEETPKGWRAHPMKKLPQRTEGLIGVVEKDGRGKFWLAPVDKKVRNSSPISDVGTAEEGQLVSAEPVGRGNRSGVRVTEVLGDPLAPNSFSTIAIAKQGIPHVFPEAVLDEAQLAALPELTSVSFAHNHLRSIGELECLLGGFLDQRSAAGAAEAASRCVV